MANITRDSHYVPQATLRRWSNDGKQILAYRTLVPHVNIPEWSLKSIRGLAYQRDLYTTLSGGQELDDFERWITKEFEERALESINKILANRQLTRDDWKHLTRFVAAQDVRTPLNFMESMHRWNQQLPMILENSIKESIKKLEQAQLEGITLKTTNQTNEFSDLLRVKVQKPNNPDCANATISAEITTGRALWIASMHHLLTGVAAVLSRHRWSIVEPYHDEEWLLTDHPVLRLNYYVSGKYDFKGGWDNKGTELMMPLSPRHLLYVQVGQKASNRFTFSQEQTHLVQKLFAERAHRWIFSRRQISWISQARQRCVDRELFMEEQTAWDGWHLKQLEVER